MTDTPIKWTLNDIGGNVVRKLQGANGEAATYSSTIFANEEPPWDIVCRLDFGYGKPEDKANAELIVHACNSHSELLKALKMALEDIERTGFTSVDTVMRMQQAVAVATPSPPESA